VQGYYHPLHGQQKKWLWQKQQHPADKAEVTEAAAEQEAGAADLTPPAATLACLLH
jgi:hypothetical protein